MEQNFQIFGIAEVIAMLSGRLPFKTGQWLSEMDWFRLFCQRELLPRINQRFWRVNWPPSLVIHRGYAIIDVYLITNTVYTGSRGPNIIWVLYHWCNLLRPAIGAGAAEEVKSSVAHCCFALAMGVLLVQVHETKKNFLAVLTYYIKYWIIGNTFLKYYIKDENKVFKYYTIRKTWGATASAIKTIWEDKTLRAIRYSTNSYVNGYSGSWWKR